MQIADGIEGDWTDVWVVEGSLAALDLAELNQRERVDALASTIVQLHCIDAAFWVIDAEDPQLVERLAAHGFTTEPYEGRPRCGLL